MKIRSLGSIPQYLLLLSRKSWLYVRVSKVTGIQWQKALLLVSVLIADRDRGASEALCASLSCGPQGRGPQSSQQLLSEWGMLLQPWCSNQLPSKAHFCAVWQAAKTERSLPSHGGRVDICCHGHAHPKARAFLPLKGWHCLQVTAVKHDMGVWAIANLLVPQFQSKDTKLLWTRNLSSLV